MFSKRVYYSELWFCNEYYVADVNIMAESDKRVFLKEIDLILNNCGKNFAYRKIKAAKLYQCIINNKKFKIAIAEIEKGIYLIGYLRYRDLQISADVANNESRKRNGDLLYKFAVKQNLDEQEEYVYIYSGNREKRLKIKKGVDTVRVFYEKFFLNPDAEIDFPENLKTDPYQFLGWYEDNGGVSIYSDFESALKDSRSYLL